jgi:hypothetical protein
MTFRQRSAGLSRSAAATFLAEAHRFSWLSGTSFGRVEHERDVSARGRIARRRQRARLPELEDPRLTAWAADDLEDGNAVTGRYLASWRRETLLDQKRPSAEVREVEVELGGPIRGVERGAGGTRRHGEEGGAELGTVRVHERDAVARADPGSVELGGEVGDVLGQAAVLERLAPGRGKRDRTGGDRGSLGDQLRERARPRHGR